MIGRFKKKATGRACGLVTGKGSRARLPRLRQRDTASQEFGSHGHGDNIMMFCAVRQKFYGVEQ
jgi:hypothetical protein